MKGSRQDQYAVHVNIAGIGDTGTWDKMTGGMVDSSDTKYPPGGMGPEIALGGRKTTDTITVSRIYDLERDHNGLVRRLLSSVGSARVTVGKQPLDPNGVPFGSPITYTGVLKSCTPPEVDSESSDAAMLQIEVTADGQPG